MVVVVCMDDGAILSVVTVGCSPVPSLSSTRVHSHSLTRSRYQLRFVTHPRCGVYVCLHENNLHLASTHYDNDSHCAHTTTPLWLCYKLDNRLGVDGAKALLPALTQMKQMTTLNLRGKFGMTHAYGLLSTGQVL